MARDMTGQFAPPRTILLVICVIIAAGSAAAVFGDVAVVDLLDDLEAELSWEPYRQIGSIHDSESRVTFAAGSDRAVVNHTQEKVIGSIYVKNGELMASERAEISIRAIFSAKTELISGPRISAIVLDPGHGGRDPGTNHSHVVEGKIYDLVEKQIVLQVSTILQGLLKRRFPGIDILMTRTDDRYLELEERVEIANSLELDDMEEAIIFVSVHANASLNPQSYGYEVWYLPPEYDRKDLVKAEGIEAVEIRGILNDMRDEEYTIESILLARSILDGMDGAVGDDSRNLGLKEESWFVVRNAKMPSVLVELGFVTNTEEAVRLSDPAYLRKLSIGLYNGVANFVDSFILKHGSIE